MNGFTEVCLWFFTTVFIWHFCALFVWDDSRFQKNRFKKTLTRLYNCTPHNKVSIIYKNKKFAVEIQHKKINDIYCYYEIFINDKLAATFHQLTGLWGNRYRFNEENKRHASEVRAIIKAADKALKYEAKPKKIKENGWNEYSYFN